MEYYIPFSSLSYDYVVLFVLGIIIGFLIKNVTENDNEKTVKPDVRSIPRSCTNNKTFAVDSSSEQLQASSTKILNVPKHVAVIMDGNRRYGKKVYGDPLKVR